MTPLNQEVEKLESE